MKLTIVSLVILLSFACFTGCKCLPEPVTDSSAPSAGLVIEWHDLDGRTQSRTISQDDSDVSLTASKDAEIIVICMGQDKQGMRRIDLEYDMIRYSGNSVIQPLLIAINLVGTCPRETLVDTADFNPGGME